jgi:hypothetical protein
MKSFDDIRRMEESFLAPVRESMEQVKHMLAIPDLAPETSALSNLKDLEAQIDFSKYERWNNLQDEIRQVQELFRRPMDNIAFTAKQILPPLDKYIDSLHQTQRYLESLYRLPDPCLYSDTLFTGIAPTVAAFQTGQIEPAAGVMTIDPLAKRGAFTWIQPKRGSLDFASAVWSRRSQVSQPPPASLDLEVTHEVRCPICDEPLLKEKEDRYWISPYKLTQVIYVTPFCIPCVECAAEDPEYWARYLPHRFKKDSRPPLRLIHGGGNGERGPSRRGSLRLVRSDEVP